MIVLTPAIYLASGFRSDSKCERHSLILLTSMEQFGVNEDAKKENIDG